MRPNFYVNLAMAVLMWASFRCQERAMKKYSPGRKQDAVVVTLDADFHAILAVSGASGPSVVRIRIEGLGAQAMVELLSHVLAVNSSHLKRGALITLKSHKITHHRLPIGHSG